MLKEEVKGPHHIFPNGTTTRNPFYDKNYYDLDDETNEETATLITR